MLLAVGFIKEVKCLDWLANVMVIPMKYVRWQVCIEYTNLNDTCLGDNFHLPRIDQVIDATTRHGMLSFLDVFSEYHHIHMF